MRAVHWMRERVAAEGGHQGFSHRHARRVAIGLVIPGVVLLVVGRPDLIIYAVFGSFTGMYGRGESRAVRLHHQVQGGAVLTAGVAIGTWLLNSHVHAGILVLVEVVFAMVVSLVADWYRLVPAGPFFGIFALGATASVAPGRCPLWLAVTICAATVVLCVVVGALTKAPVTSRDSPPMAPHRLVVHAARYGVAVSIAGGIGVLLGVDHANWAMASAAVPLTALDPARPRRHGLGAVFQRSVHRVAGTFVGLGLSALLLLPRLDETILAVIVIVLLFPTELFMSRHYGLALGFFTPLIMLMTELADPSDPVTLLVDRGIDTTIGVLVGIGAALIRWDSKRKAHRQPVY